MLVSIAAGKAVAFGLDSLQQRAELHVAPGDVCYEGMIVGENSRPNDMDVNPTKEKKLSNMRAVGHDRNILLKPARRMSLEEALEFIAEDELVEVTPVANPPAKDPAQRDRPPPGESASGVVGRSAMRERSAGVLARRGVRRMLAPKPAANKFAG